MKSRALLLALALFSGFWVQASLAETIPIAGIVFDETIPAGVVPGVNSFTLFNETGGLTAPGPGVLDSLSLSGQLVLDLRLPDSTTVTQTISFSGVGLGGADIFDLTSSDQVLSAMLTGTLSPTSATVNGGISPVNLSLSFTVADPFKGAIPLATCTGGGPCAAEIDATVVPTLPTVPEPGPLSLLGTGAGVAWFVRKRPSRKTG